MNREGGGHGVAGVIGLGDGAPVNGQGQGLGIGAQPGLGVEAQVEQRGGGVVPGLIAAGVAQSVGAHEIHIHQAHISGGEGGEQIVSLAHLPQREFLGGQRLVLPPAGAGGKGEPLFRFRQYIRAGTRRTLGIAQSDGNVQQSGQGAVGTGENDGHRALVTGDGYHRGEALGIAGALLPGQIQRVGHHRSGERRAVGEGDVGLQEEGPGEAILADGVALAQHSLGLKLLVQLE